MPRYLFTGDHPLILFGVEAPEGGTLTAHPGDEVQTKLPYHHPHLVRIPDPDKPKLPVRSRRKDTPPTHDTETQE